GSADEKVVRGFLTGGNLGTGCFCGDCVVVFSAAFVLELKFGYFFGVFQFLGCGTLGVSILSDWHRATIFVPEVVPQNSPIYSVRFCVLVRSRHGVGVWTGMNRKARLGSTE